MILPRPPIVVILGHVDHGKTSLLDALRKTNVVASEHGGITQHTRAFQLQSPVTVTFIDTPGHAAFAQMRGRGGRIADLGLLIVSAVDGVMPQTIESIQLAQQTNLPLIVVLTKIDLPEADVDKVKRQLLEQQVLLEGMGGQVPVVEVSAKTGQGLPQLLELINLVTSLNPPMADAQGSVQAVVLESLRDAKRGILATVIVKEGTLRVGQELFTDSLIGKVKALTTTDGQAVHEAGPSLPVEILGLAILPAVGVVIGEKAMSVKRAAGQTVSSAPGLLKIILKADVAGSLEAIVASLPPEVQIITAGTGEIAESDVLLAQSTGARIIGFNTRVPTSVVKLAETDKVSIKTFTIIYELLDALAVTLAKIKNPHLGEVVLGKATIVAEFKIDTERVAGCKCTEGAITKSEKARISRDGQLVAEVKFKSLKSGKSDVLTIKVGQEFGAVFSPYVDFRIGDTIICYRHDSA